MLPPDSLKMLYSTLILPHIQYGLVVWGNSKGINKNRITKIQKRVVRIISKSYLKSHTEPRMKKLGILKIEDVYKHQCLTLVHDALNENCPEVIKGLVELTANKNSYSLRAKEQNPLDIQKPNLRSRQGQSSFRMRGPSL